MAVLFANGLFLALGIILGLIFTVIGLFLGHIILFDSIALGIIAGVCCNHFLSIHPAICVVIGVALFLLLLWLQYTKVGFWIVGGLLSLVYAFVFSAFAYGFSHRDPVWAWVVFGLSFLIMGGLHIYARYKD